MKCQNILTFIQKRNIWTRPISPGRRGDVLATTHEAGLMASEIALTVLTVLLTFLTVMSIGNDGHIEIDIVINGFVFGPVIFFCFYVAGSLFGLVMHYVAKFLSRFSSLPLFVGVSILVFFMLFKSILPVSTMTRIIENDRNNGFILAVPYLILCVLAGRFGAKLYEVRQLL